MHVRFFLYFCAIKGRDGIFGPQLSTYLIYDVNKNRIYTGKTNPSFCANGTFFFFFCYKNVALCTQQAIAKIQINFTYFTLGWKVLAGDLIKQWPELYHICIDQPLSKHHLEQLIFGSLLILRNFIFKPIQMFLFYNNLIHPSY